MRTSGFSLTCSRAFGNFFIPHFNHGKKGRNEGGGSHPRLPYFVADFIFFIAIPRPYPDTALALRTRLQVPLAVTRGPGLYRVPPLSSWSLESSWVSLFRLFYMIFSPLHMRRGLCW